MAYAEETQEVSFIEQYWTQISEALSMKQDETFFEELETRNINYRFQDNIRVSKTVGDKITYFTYDTEGGRVEELCDGIVVIYQYDEQGILDTVAYNNNVYYAETDDNGSVVKLLNSNNECVVNYIYSNGDATIITESKGGTYDSIIGEVNKVRLYSLYYDAETGYYCGGRFFDAESGVFVDKLKSNNMNDAICNISLKRDTISDLGNSITQWANYLLNYDPNYGEPKAAVSEWYEELSDVELIARLIFGENSSNRQDQKAIMWVLLNRKYYNGYATLRDVATAANQFATIWDTGSRLARRQGQEQYDITMNQAWEYATWLACAICTTTDEAQCTSLINKPQGITTQTSFRSLTGFTSRCYNSTNGNYIVMKVTYNNIENHIKIRDVVIVGDLCNTSDKFWTSHLVNATRKEQIDSYAGCGYTKAVHNIFFNEFGKESFE